MIFFNKYQNDNPLLSLEYNCFINFSLFPFKLFYIIQTENIYVKFQAKIKMKKSNIDDYFDVLRENNLYKFASVSLSVVITVTLLPLIYGIIWFERFGSDKKRTLINMLVSSTCWTVIQCGVLLQVPDIVHLVIGPLPEKFCFFQAILRSTFASEFLLYFDAIIAMRFVYIFCLKNLANFRDEFWSQFHKLI